MSDWGVETPVPGPSPAESSSSRESRGGARRTAARATALQLVAYHEAGHVVAWLWSGEKIELVNILRPPDRSARGRCSLAPRATAAATPSACRAYVVALYAGSAAEALLSRKRHADVLGRLAGDRADRRLASDLVASLWPGFLERRCQERRYRRLALALVRRYRTRIERVAEALLHFACLSGVEASLAADGGPDAVAEHRSTWTGRDPTTSAPAFVAGPRRPAPASSGSGPINTAPVASAPVPTTRRLRDAELQRIAAEPTRYGPGTTRALAAELCRLRGMILDFDTDERAGGCALLDEAWAIRSTHDGDG